MHTPSPPTPPDPAQQASAQTSTNLATAQGNAAMNNFNQVTPYGNLTYSQTGTQFIHDPNGQQYWDNGNGKLVGTNQTYGSPSDWTSVKGEYVPTYTATQTMSPSEKAIFDQTQAAQLNLGTLANQESAKMINYLNQPVDLSAANIDKYSNTHWMPQFNNTWDRNQASMNQKLADDGVQLGSQAYSNATRDFYTSKQAADDQYLGDMYDRAQQAILTQRNQPINEISALLGGSQVGQPNYASSSPTSAIPTVDVAGLEQQNFQDKMGIYQQQLANSNAAMGGLFGLGSAALGGWARTGFSDRRLKHDIERVGTLASGLPLYEYNFIWGGKRERGVMADEARAFFPDAVTSHPAGFDMVDYARIG